MNIWYKAFEVCITGVIGVYLVMFLLQLLTQLGTAAIDRFEAWKKGAAQEDEPVQASDSSPERVGNPPC